MNEFIPTSLDQPKRANKKATVIFGAVVIAVLVVAGIFILKLQTKKTEKKQVETNITKPTTPPEPSPTPPLPTIDKKLIKIKVLNGTGTPGQAGSVVEILTKNGFVSNTIETGNADEFVTTTTTIKAKTTSKGVAQEISSLLEQAIVDSQSLDESDKYDIIITTGGKKYETTPTPTSEKSKITPSPSPQTTPTPSPTPTSTPTP